MNGSPPAEGATVAPFTVGSTRGRLAVPDPDGRDTLLMFYVEAGTPLCTAQVGAVERDAALLAEANAVAIAVSTDPIERQQAFASRCGAAALAFAADPDGALAQRFGVYDEATRRARRAAFVIGGDGRVKSAQPWYNPANSDQYAALFGALLPDLEESDG